MGPGGMMHMTEMMRQLGGMMNDEQDVRWL